MASLSIETPVASTLPDVSPALSVRNLRTYFETPAGTVRAVDDVSFDLGRRDVLAIVGESGSGKSVTALSIMKLVPSPPGRYVSGSAMMEGTDLMALGPRELVAMRGRKLAMIFQNPRAALNPSFTIRSQIVETLRRHNRSLTAADAEQQIVATMRDAVDKTLQEPEVVSRFNSLGAEPVGGSPEEQIRRESAKWKRVIANSKIEAE